MKTPTLDFETVGADYLLMDGLVQQQPEALKALHARYHALLRHLVLQIVNDAAEADDVLQEVFVQLWNRPKTYCASKGKPLGWLITLTRRRAIDSVRRRQVYRHTQDRLECSQNSQSELSPREESRTSEASRRDLRSYLFEMMGKLPPAQRAVVERAFFGGLSQRQIAVSMGVSLGTIKTRYELGLKKLAHAILPCRAMIE